MPDSLTLTLNRAFLPVVAFDVGVVRTCQIRPAPSFLLHPKPVKQIQQPLHHRVQTRRARPSHLFRPFDLRDIMHEHALNASFQRHRTRVAPTTAPLQLDPDNPIVGKPTILNIPTVLHDRRAHARVQKLLNHRDRLRIRLQNPRVLGARPRGVLLCRAEQRPPPFLLLAPRKVLHQHRVHLRLDDRPRVLPVLRDGDKVRTVKDGFDALDAEETQGERGHERGARVEEFGGASGLHHGHAGDELERVCVWRRLCLYEHGPGYKSNVRAPGVRRESE
jgi:hypothetical protein